MWVKKITLTSPPSIPPLHLLCNNVHLINTTFHSHSRLFCLVHILFLSQLSNTPFSTTMSHNFCISLHNTLFFIHTHLLSTVHTLESITSAIHFSTLSTSSQQHHSSNSQQLFLNSTVYTLKSTNSAFHFITHSLLSCNTLLDSSKCPQITYIKSAPQFTIIMLVV